MPWTNFLVISVLSILKLIGISNIYENLADPTILNDFSLSSRPRWLLLGDIRFVQMLNCWRSSSFLKLGLTSFAIVMALV